VKVDNPEQLRLDLIEIGDTSKQTVLVPPDISSSDECPSHVQTNSQVWAQPKDIMADVH